MDQTLPRSSNHGRQAYQGGVNVAHLEELSRLAEGRMLVLDLNMYGSADEQLRVRRQDGSMRHLIRGNGQGLRIEMWYSADKKQIERAYPKGWATKCR